MGESVERRVNAVGIFFLPPGRRVGDIYNSSFVMALADGIFGSKRLEITPSLLISCPLAA
jgi:hypothetical protein